jgi:four helix bundle suffix protein
MKSTGAAVCPCQSVSSLPVRENPRKPAIPPECFVANGALSLLNLACWFLDRQVERLATDFENEGGFTERLYKVRSEKRRNK